MPETVNNEHEMDLRKIEALFRQINDSRFDIIGKADENMCFEYVSPAFHEILGYEPEEILGESIVKHVHPDDYPHIFASLKELINSRQPKKVEYRYQHKNGHYIWLETAGTPLFEQGTFSGAIYVSRDISERKETEANLRKTEADYQDLFNSMQEGFALWEIIYDEHNQPVDYKFLDVNPTYEKTARVSKNKLIGSLISEQKYYIEDYWWQLFDKVALTGHPQEYEGYFRNLDMYFEVFAFRPNPSSLACTLVDTSRRRKAEIALENEKEWLSVTLGSIAEGVIATDPDSQVLFLNQVAAEILGWSQENAVGQQLSDLLNSVEQVCSDKSDGEHLNGFIEMQTAELNDNMVCIVRNGVRRFLSNSASPIRDKEGNDLGMVMVLRDITDRKKAEEQIQYLSYNDKLTGVYNRAYIDKILTDLNQSEQLPLSMIIGDVNGLKLTNDVFGHQEGDRLLVKMADILKKCCRDSDVVARWGGDEFLIILPRTKAEVAAIVCDRINRSCQEAGFDPIELSISLGTATREDMQQNIVEIFSLAEDRMYNQKLVASKQARASIIAGLQKSLHDHSHENEEHIRRLVAMALKIGAFLERNKNELDELALLASLHDIGNIAISRDILQKTDALDSDDWEKIKKHPEIGYRMAQSIPEIAFVAEAILAHHERWDGSGYPQGLSGQQIPLLARIISVVDAFDIMTHETVYKTAVSPDVALAQLRQGSGTQFDPDIVKTFIDLWNAANFNTEVD